MPKHCLYSSNVSVASSRLEGSLEATLRAHMWPANATGMEKIRPITMTQNSPSGPIPTFVAAAIGPGVGVQAYEWRINRLTVQRPGVTTLTPVFFVNDFFREERITYPQSQKTGMDTIQPIMDIAIAGWRSPSSLRTTSAIFTAAPDFSRIFPIIVPKMITRLVIKNGNFMLNCNFSR